MEFDFSSHDYNAFAEMRSGFIADLADWHLGRSDRALGTHHVELFLGWNFEHREEPLRTLGPADFEEYLLDFLPRRYLGGPEDVPEIRHSLEAMVEFLALIEHLDQPYARAASIIAFLTEIESEFAEAMGDDSKAGLGKSLLGAQLIGDDGGPLPDLDKLLDSEDLSIEELQGLLDERVQAFNSLPFDERKRITDTGPLRQDPTPLGFTYVPPPTAEVEASAEASDVLRMVDGFVRVAMERGVGLTDAGYIKPADAKRLVAELQTGDDLTGLRTSIELRWLTLVGDLATLIGAVDRKRTVIRADGSWFDLSVVERATALGDTIIESGFVSSRPEPPTTWMASLSQLIDGGVPHWFGAGLVEGQVVDADELMELGVDVASSTPVAAFLSDEVVEEVVVDLMTELFEGLVRFGLLTWSGAHDRPRDDWSNKARLLQMSKRSAVPMGGTLALTALGRYVLPKHVELAGYSFETLADIGDASPKQLVEHALTTGRNAAELLAQWRVDDPMVDRLSALAERVRVGGSVDRLVIFGIFDEVADRSIVEPIVRQLLDSTAGGHAAAVLLERGWADADAVGAFIDLTPLVDMLYIVSDSAEDFDVLFRDAYAKIEGDLLDDLWRHDQPETIVVLDAAGQFVTDKALAKRARTAAHKHRSWLTNLDR